MFETRHIDVSPSRRTAPALLAMLALLVRLISAVAPFGGGPVAIASVDAAAFTALMGGVICHGDSLPDTAPPNPVGGSHGHDCVLCPACLGFATTQPERPVLRAAPVQTVVVRFAGPPAVPFSTAQPRGPPAVS